MKPRRSILLTSVLAGGLAAPGNFGAEPAPKFRWVQDSLEDFAAGTFDAGGADLFVTRRGTIRTTHRFDLNGDSHLDLAIACHTRNGTHDTESLVFFGDGARFKRSLPLRLPTVGPHFMQRADVGNLYDRTLRHTYASAVFSWQ